MERRHGGPVSSNSSQNTTPIPPSSGSLGSEAVSPPAVARRSGVGAGFRRFFFRGLAALMPTLITLWLLVWLWNFLWNSIGQHVIFLIRWIWLRLGDAGVVNHEPSGHIRRVLNDDDLDVPDVPDRSPTLTAIIRSICQNQCHWYLTAAAGYFGRCHWTFPRNSRHRWYLVAR